MLFQQFPGAITILQVAGMDHDAQQETERVDEDMTLAARVERRSLLRCLGLWVFEAGCGRAPDVERMVEGLQRTVLGGEPFDSVLH